MAKMDLESTKVHLCDGCHRGHTFPMCLPDEDEVEYGNGNGIDNIIKCTDYEPEF